MDLKITRAWFEKTVKLEENSEIGAMNPIYLITEETFENIVTKVLQDIEREWYSFISLSSLVNGVYTYKLECPNVDNTPYIEEFVDWREDAESVLCRKKSEYRANRIRRALFEEYERVLNDSK